MPFVGPSPTAGAHFEFGRSTPTRLPASSLESVSVGVMATLNGSAVDPTGSSVAFGFASHGAEPDPEDYVDGGWETTGSGFVATCLVGTGGAAELEPGLYGVWAKLTDDPEIPVSRVGDLGVY